MCLWSLQLGIYLHKGLAELSWGRSLLTALVHGVDTITGEQKSRYRILNAEYKIPIRSRSFPGEPIIDWAPVRMCHVVEPWIVMSYVSLDQQSETSITISSTILHHHLHHNLSPAVISLALVSEGISRPGGLWGGGELKGWGLTCLPRIRGDGSDPAR